MQPRTLDTFCYQCHRCAKEIWVDAVSHGRADHYARKTYGWRSITRKRWVCSDHPPPRKTFQGGT